MSDDLSAKLAEYSEIFNPYYKLDDNNNVVKCTIKEWTLFVSESFVNEFDRQSSRRIVQQDQVDHYFVSTIFLGINHNFNSTGIPILFETMIFNETNGRERVYCAHYATWDKAKAGHEKIVDDLNNGKACLNDE